MIARSRKNQVEHSATTPALACIGPDSEVVGQRDRAFPERADVGENREGESSVSQIENHGEISQPGSGGARQISGQGDVGNSRGIHEPRGIEAVFGPIGERRARNVVSREGISGALNERVACLVLEQPLPMTGLASVGQVVEPCVVRVIGVGRAVRIDRHTGAKEEGQVIPQVPNGQLANGFSPTIQLEIKKQRSDRAAVRQGTRARGLIGLREAGQGKHQRKKNWGNFLQTAHQLKVYTSG